MLLHLIIYCSDPLKKFGYNWKEKIGSLGKKNAYLHSLR